MAKILAVDDQLTIRELLHVILTNHGHEVVLAEDGIDGLAKAKNQYFDLIISDINMPKMDGISLVAKVRQLEHLKYVPILMLTTESSADKKTNARVMGASGWLTKPFDSNRLSGAVKKLLAKVNS